MGETEEHDGYARPGGPQPAPQQSATETYGYPPPGGMGDMLTTVAVTMAVTPFLQAVAAHFGNRLAGAVDEGTRAAVRRFLRRESGRRTGDLRSESDGPIDLRNEHGWHVVIPVEVPAEALPQLFALQSAPSPYLAAEPTPCIQWIGDAWHVMGARDGVTVLWRWDAAEGRWTP
ncbi:hypothetical protein [Streptomyces sclerotialus]|uniref:hypothetical protein n=1 Tax=Streptomyces sclerotialus TaxID=1957 RepID=UPI0004C5CE75